MYESGSFNVVIVFDMVKKYCDVGNHNVEKLWRSRKRDPKTRDLLVLSCCKDCLPRAALKTNKKKKAESKEMNVFFASQLLEITKSCENCGEPLDLSSNFSIRAQTAHILPKSIFKTVATHPQNRMFICCFHGCNGHGDWDNLDADKRKSMPVYEKAIERFRNFETMLPVKDRIRAYKYLGLDEPELL